MEFTTKHAFEQIDVHELGRALNRLADMYKWEFGSHENEEGALDESGQIILLVWFEDLPLNGQNRRELKRRVIWCMRNHGFDVSEKIENCCGQYWYMVFSRPDTQPSFESLEQKIYDRLPKANKPTEEQREKMIEHIGKMYDALFYSRNEISDMIYYTSQKDLIKFCDMVLMKDL